MGYKHDVLSHRQQITVEKMGVNVYFTAPLSHHLTLTLRYSGSNFIFYNYLDWVRGAKQQSSKVHFSTWKSSLI